MNTHEIGDIIKGISKHCPLSGFECFGKKGADLIHRVIPDGAVPDP